jgi:hypothetical protein
MMNMRLVNIALETRFGGPPIAIVRPRIRAHQAHRSGGARVPV